MKKKKLLPPVDKLGPARPIYKTKYYNCKKCGAKTINRFKCPTCWAEFLRIHEDVLI
jgi:DNA-directed RNA polymerase subunit RPC12/RpoP